MKVNRIKIQNYRNIENMELFPHEGVNIIFGENAQGKTNLLESIWLFSGFRSFRGSKDNDLIKFGEDHLISELDFYGGDRDQNSKMIIRNNQKRILLNSVPLTASSKLIGNFNCVVFSPAYLSLVKGNPSERRKFIDSALCQLKPKYTKLLRDYSNTLNQRNACIKAIKQTNLGKEMLEIWTDNLANKGAALINARLKYLSMLSLASADIYSGLSGEKESFSASYKLKISSSRYEEITENVTEAQLLNLFKKSEYYDLQTGSTQIGPHHDDIDIKINEISAKTFGSQGQQRSAALALKLGEARLLKDMTGENPVALLDDVMSELDVGRQDYILNHIKDWQVFITCCEPSTVLRLCQGKTFEIKNGGLV